MMHKHKNLRKTFYDLDRESFDQLAEKYKWPSFRVDQLIGWQENIFSLLMK